MPTVEMVPLECRQPSAQGLFESLREEAIWMAVVCHKKIPRRSGGLKAELIQDSALMVANRNGNQRRLA